MEHALLAGRTRTGVTVQTLDDRAFDEGHVLLQGPTAAESEKEAPGLAIPPRCTADELHRLLAPLGADLLVQTLRRGLYLPGTATASTPNLTLTPTPILAPKLSKADQQVPWRQHQPGHTPTTAEDIDRRARALGPLWTHVMTPLTQKRAILQDIDLVTCPDSILLLLRKQAADNGRVDTADSPCALQTATFVQRAHQDHSAVTLPFIVATDGSESIILPVGISPNSAGSSLCLRIGTIKIEGDRAKPAARAIGGLSSQGTLLGQVAWDVALHK